MAPAPGFSRRNKKPNAAAISGAVAKMIATCATLVRCRAAMNRLMLAVVATTIAQPGRPSRRKSSNVRRGERTSISSATAPPPQTPRQNRIVAVSMAISRVISPAVLSSTVEIATRTRPRV